MDLTLALGFPVGSMTENEFARWHQYVRRKGLPLQRIEWALAMVALKITQTFGGNADAKLDDFLFDPLRDDDGRLIDPPEPDVEDEAQRWMG